MDPTVDYAIVCAGTSGRTASGHHHVTQVGVSTASGTRIYSVQRVYSLMDQGHTFHAVSRSGKQVDVEPWHCCHLDTLRSRADGVLDNTLDELPPCT